MKKEYDLFIEWDKEKNHDLFSRIKQEFLFRLNPHWAITSFTRSAQSYTIELADHETGQTTTFKGLCSLDEDGFPEITGDGNDWLLINFYEKNGSLHAEVTYPEEPSEEAERQLVLWLRSIKEYLRLYTKTTINTRFFRLLMNRVILQMTPSQRKISLMLVRITIIELLVILIILGGWYFFLR